MSDWQLKKSFVSTHILHISGSPIRTISGPPRLALSISGTIPLAPLVTISSTRFQSFGHLQINDLIKPRALCVSSFYTLCRRILRFCSCCLFLQAKQSLTNFERVEDHTTDAEITSKDIFSLIYSAYIPCVALFNTYQFSNSYLVIREVDRPVHLTLFSIQNGCHQWNCEPAGALQECH
jgi:hypothetical protein